MSYLGDIFNFENFNLKNIGNKIAKNPERLLFDTNNPITAGFANKVLGTDYEPLTDQFGGATNDTYDKAQAQGINTGPGKTMHGIAKAITSFYAGGYGAGKAGGLLGNSSGTVGNAGYGDYTNPNWFNQANQSIPMGSGGGGWQSSLQSGLGSLKSGLSTANDYAKPVSQGIGYAQQAQGLLGGQQQPMQAPQLPQGGQVDVSGILGAQNQQQAQLEAQRAARRARQTGILGGNYG